MSEYKVTTSCVVSASTPVEAAQEADQYLRFNNNIFSVNDGLRTTIVDLADHEED